MRILGGCGTEAEFQVLAWREREREVLRGTRRAGELLLQIQPGQGARDGKRGEGDHTPFRNDAARDAGMSTGHKTAEGRKRIAETQGQR